MRSWIFLVTAGLFLAACEPAPQERPATEPVTEPAPTTEPPPVMPPDTPTAAPDTPTVPMNGAPEGQPQY